MTILFGHPTGNANVLQAAQAHYDAGWLEAFCTAWLPSRNFLTLLDAVPALSPVAQRLSRRQSEALQGAPVIQSPLAEIFRLMRMRLAGRGLSGRDANHWLMQTMSREIHRSSVSAVHSYEDCSHLQFAEAKRLGKACIYDMPIGYFPAWQHIEHELLRKYAADWLPQGCVSPDNDTRDSHKRLEMDLADIVLSPSAFVDDTIRTHRQDKQIARARYGVDTEFWRAGPRSAGENLVFIFAGQVSLRKGIPLLLTAWEAAGLKNATLQLAGSWHLSDLRRKSLPHNVAYLGSCPPEALRARFAAADVFVLPSYFEGLSLAALEAMSCGLPAIVSDSSGITRDIVPNAGHIVPAGELDALVESLRWFSANRDKVAAMSRAARSYAEAHRWRDYRKQVADAVRPFAGS